MEKTRQKTAREREEDLGLQASASNDKRPTHGNEVELTVSISAFSALRILIPTEPSDRKLSKIETLRLASSYIAHLGSMLRSGTQCPNVAKVAEHSGAISPSSASRVCTFCLSLLKAVSDTSIHSLSVHIVLCNLRLQYFYHLMSWLD